MSRNRSDETDDRDATSRDRDANRDKAGMASSIRAGMERLVARAETRAVVVMLCDQPCVGAPLINALVAAYRVTGAPLVAAKYNGTHGVPALFGRRLYPALLALTGSQGAKNIILAHSARLSEVSAPEAAFDVDTLADYERLHAGLSQDHESGGRASPIIRQGG